MLALPANAYTEPPRITERGIVPRTGKKLPRAVELAHAYVHNPEHPVFRGYLWCADTDSQDQRVFVGGTANGKGFEIHRHLHVDERFSIPEWP